MDYYIRIIKSGYMILLIIIFNNILLCSLIALIYNFVSTSSFIWYIKSYLSIIKNWFFYIILLKSALACYFYYYSIIVLVYTHQYSIY